MRSTKTTLIASVDKALRKEGINPDEVARVNVFSAMLEKVLKHKWTVEKLVQSCKKIAVINKKLRLLGH